MSAAFEFTRLANASGVLTKRISLRNDGKLVIGMTGGRG